MHLPPESLLNFCFSFPLHDDILPSKQQQSAVFGGRRWKDSAIFANGVEDPP